MQVLITGGQGRLARDLQATFSPRYTCITPDRDELDILQYKQLHTQAAHLVRLGRQTGEPTAVIHAAAITDVDYCEKDPDAAFKINAWGTANVARACADWNLPLLVISTDYVFDGYMSTGYDEWSLTCPRNVYGQSKLAGEHLARQIHPSCSILRVQNLYGAHGSSFVNWVLQHAREDGKVMLYRTPAFETDRRICPTWTAEIARIIEQLLPLTVSRSLLPTYHLTTGEEAKPAEVVDEILRILDIPAEILFMNEPPDRAIRPTHVRLLPRALKMHGVEGLRPWKEQLAEYFAVTVK